MNLLLLGGFVVLFVAGFEIGARWQARLATKDTLKALRELDALRGQAGKR